MSRGFVKEDDQEEIPMVPKRAYLPDGVPNFVTPEGMNQLLAEKRMIISERDSISMSNENEKRITVNHINARLQLLVDRIETARIINPEEQPANEIRFSARVTVRTEETGDIQSFQIVGVDEADIAKGKISFISPMAKLLINKKPGDSFVMKRAGKDTKFVITGIEYKR